MAAPLFVAAGAHLDGTAASASIAVPAGTSAGRVVVVSMYLDGVALAVNPTPAVDFAPVEGCPVQIASGGGTHSLYKWWKRCTATDTDPYVFTWAEARYREAEVTLWQNVVATGTPWDSPTGAAFLITNSATTPPVSVTTLGPDRTLIWSGTNWSGGTWTAPAGFTKRVQSSFGLITECDGPFPTAGPTGPVSGTCSASDKTCAWMGALIGTTGAATATAPPPPRRPRMGALLQL